MTTVSFDGVESYGDKTGVGQGYLDGVIDTTTSVNIGYNTTANGTQTTIGTKSKFDNFYFYQTEQLVFLSLLLCCTVVGNSIVLLAVGLSRRRHSRMHFFIMHLALADLSVGLITVLIDLVWKITVKWYVGDVMCKLVKFAQAFVMFASTYMLVALSIDRYDAIARPLNFSTTWTRCKVLVGLAWGISAVFASPMLFTAGVPDGQLECWVSFPSRLYWKVYFLSVTAAVLVLPALIITGCYAMIIHIIWKNSHLLAPDKPKHLYTADTKHLMPSNGTSNGYSSKGSPKPNRTGNMGRSSRGIIPQAKIRTIKMTFSIVLVFILCWSPYFVFNTLHLFDRIPATQEMVAVSTFIQSLAPLNSAVNPIIYGIFSTRICRYLRALRVFRFISKIFCCQDGPTPRSSGISEFSNITETVDYTRRSPRLTPMTTNNIEMCDLILSSQQKERKFN